MKRTSAIRFLAVAAATAALGFAGANPAAANGAVDWTNKMTGTCLDVNSKDYATMGPCTGDKNWYDVMQNDTNWIEFENGSDGRRCLDSNARGSVYVGPCDAPEKNNRYQRWSEEKWKGGWVLKNVATGRCLAIDKADVRTLPCNANNPWQFWE
ncbi:ricin-type beta-trefoil lectin domain protein [Streptomyces cinnamoneus]|uniref:RICIN domain-containing protein n=1 Tax=Streptomyces cinnamoneus TaxID=53446 RepID=UPI0034498F9B